MIDPEWDRIRRHIRQFRKDELSLEQSANQGGTREVIDESLMTNAVAALLIRMRVRRFPGFTDRRRRLMIATAKHKLRIAREEKRDYQDGEDSGAEKVQNPSHS